MEKNLQRVRVSGAVALPGYLRERGGRPERVLGAARVVPIELESEENWIDFDRMGALYEAAARELDDELFGWRFGEQVPLRSYGPLAYAVLNAPDVRTGLQNVARFASDLSISVERSVLRADGALAEVGFGVNRSRLESCRQLLESHVSSLVTTARQLVGREWEARGISLQRARRSNDEALEAHLGVEVRFGSDLNGVSFDASFLDLTVVGADRSLLPAIDRRLSEVPSAERSGFAGRVSQEVARILCDGTPAIEKVARRMAMSPRTLQRRLTEEGASFRELVVDVRMSIGQAYLSDRQLGVSEVARLLGYAKASSFTHAFRTAHGVSPQEWRRTHTPDRARAHRQGGH